jgi:hypothetical protein
MTKEEFKQLLEKNEPPPLTSTDFSSVFTGLTVITPSQIFSLQNPTLIPNVISFQYVDVNALIKSLLKDFFTSEKSIVRMKTYNFLVTQEESECLIIQFRKDLILSAKEEDDRGSLRITYSHEVPTEILNFLTEYIKAFRYEATRINYLNLLVDNDEGALSLTPMEIKHDTPLDIKLNYNDDFLEISELIIERLKRKEDKGLVLLHGAPGTGKTTFIRHLISSVGKRLIYIPTDYAHHLGTKEFMSLLLRNSDSILIIEDAENILLSRTEMKSSSVASLLNISDGLLSDVLNIQVVCTFNTSISKIDDALKRKGRLIAQYEFKPLAKEKTLALLTHLEVTTTLDEAMTLSEIYNLNEKGFNGVSHNKIGFGSNNPQ